MAINFKQFRPEVVNKSERVESPVESVKFTLATPAAVTDTVGIDSTNRAFHVHPLMAEHLGLEEKQASQREHEIQREIDRRWVEAKEKAEVEGYTAGLNTGKREAYLAEKPRIEEKLKRLETLLQSVDSMTANIFLANEDFLTKLMAQLLQIIAIKEIELDKEYLNRLVLHLINQMADRRELTLTIGELDLVLVQKLREAIEHKFPELTTLRILTNIDLKPGSCRLETKSVMIDASLENQIRNAMQVLSEDRGKPVK